MEWDGLQHDLSQVCGLGWGPFLLEGGSLSTGIRVLGTGIGNEVWFCSLKRVTFTSDMEIFLRDAA